MPTMHSLSSSQNVCKLTVLFEIMHKQGFGSESGMEKY